MRSHPFDNKLRISTYQTYYEWSPQASHLLLATFGSDLAQRSKLTVVTRSGITKEVNVNPAGNGPSAAETSFVALDAVWQSDTLLWVVGYTETRPRTAPSEKTYTFSLLTVDVTLAQPGITATRSLDLGSYQSTIDWPELNGFSVSPSGQYGIISWRMTGNASRPASAWVVPADTAAPAVELVSIPDVMSALWVPDRDEAILWSQQGGLFHWQATTPASASPLQGVSPPGSTMPKFLWSSNGTRFVASFGLQLAGSQTFGTSVLMPAVVNEQATSLPGVFVGTYPLGKPVPGYEHSGSTPSLIWSRVLSRPDVLHGDTLVLQDPKKAQKIILYKISSGLSMSLNQSQCPR